MTDHARRRLAALTDAELLRHAASVLRAEFDARRRNDGRADRELERERDDCWLEACDRRSGMWEEALAAVRADLKRDRGL